MHLPLAIPSEASGLEISYIANNFIVSILLIIFTRRLHQVVKYAYNQIIDLCNSKKKAITRSISNFEFALLHLIDRTGRICDTIDFAKPS